MVKRVLFGLLKERISADPSDIWFTALILMLIAAFLKASLFASALVCFSAIVTVICAISMLADLLFLGKHPLLENDKDREEAKARLWAKD